MHHLVIMMPKRLEFKPNPIMLLLLKKKELTGHFWSSHIIPLSLVSQK